MSEPDIIIVFGHNSHRGDLVEELSVPIYYAALKENRVYVGVHPSIGSVLSECAKYSHAMLTFRGVGILFFRQENGKWMVE